MMHRALRGSMSRSVSTNDSAMLLPMNSDMSSSAHKRPNVQRSFSLTNRNTRSMHFGSHDAPVRLYKAVAGVLCIAVVALGYLVMDHTKAMDRLKYDLGHGSNVMSQLQQRVATFEQENLKLSRELQLAEQQARSLEQGLGGDTQLQELDAKIKQLVQQKHATHDMIQHFSMKQLMTRFGPGPHRVEIFLEFDPISNIANEPGGDRILIELAPESEMPHTVYWFLEQVEQGLYNGASFHRNAEHVIQAGPVPNFATPKDAHLAQNFRQSGFNSVLFQEYSANFPHSKYTLGYAGRPGGPDFYISVRDNNDIHGPGGQSKYNDPGEADPCFAKIIEGIDAVERMQKASIKPGQYHRMEHFVAIRHMRRISGDAQHHDEHHDGSDGQGALEEGVRVED